MIVCSCRNAGVLQRAEHEQSLKAWRAAFIGNLVAILGVAIGMFALALRAGPRTSNDLYHRIMLALAATRL